MDSDDKDLKNVEKVLAAGDAWLRKYGVVSDYAHNNIILNIRAAFHPIVQDLEYLIDPNNEKKVIDLTLYVDVKELLLNGKGKYLNTLTKFIPDFTMFLNKDRQKKLDDLLDVLPNSDVPVFNKAKGELITNVREMLSEYLTDFDITIRLKRFKEKT